MVLRVMSFVIGAAMLVGVGLGTRMALAEPMPWYLWLALVVLGFLGLDGVYSGLMNRKPLFRFLDLPF